MSFCIFCYLFTEICCAHKLVHRLLVFFVMSLRLGAHRLSALTCTTNHIFLVEHVELYVGLGCLC